MFTSKSIIAILLATLWIVFSEFLRNQLLFASYWVGHYKSLGLVFPSAPINGAVWGLWSLLFAIGIFVLTRKFDLLATTMLAWLFGFVLMWVVTWNMGVLPSGILPFAVPLSLLESFLATWIILKVAGPARD